MRKPNVGTTGVAATNRGQALRNFGIGRSQTSVLIQRRPANSEIPKCLTPELRRRGITAIEIILTLPIFIIAVMAIVELGLLVSNEQIVEMSSRAGTQVASKLATIPSSGAVPASVQAAVARELAQVGATHYHVRLEHNINFAGGSGATMAPVVLTTVTAGGPPYCPPPPTVTLTPNRRYVRVTVCVYSTELTPNLLHNFGVDLSTRVSDQTTLRRFVN